jgi:DNA-binding XRE family transcriptional regulator
MADVGRPTKYKTEYAEQAYKLCLLGATDADMAKFFDVEEQTINNWKKDYPDFFESIKKGKIQADSEIASKLYHRAKGYEHDEDYITQFQGQPVIVPTVKHYPPDTTAAIFWLKNRQPDKWRDKQEVDQNIANKNGEAFNISVVNMSTEELEKQAKELAKKIASES